ncbi:hypothetical protein CLAFUW4_11870 [Fulvia fulva]|nr:hypothetical protein CLAFUR4_11875 [Fulvia fulva]WPV18191.1 hypothetical protein CLAFUW4_11870 [Fulvia fulva]WPV33631.1 hypothetical protein CLAFUW7_11877 [Fulvia fulva]
MAEQNKANAANKAAFAAMEAQPETKADEENEAEHSVVAQPSSRRQSQHKRAAQDTEAVEKYMEAQPKSKNLLWSTLSGEARRQLRAASRALADKITDLRVEAGELRFDAGNRPGEDAEILEARAAELDIERGQAEALHKAQFGGGP